MGCVPVYEMQIVGVDGDGFGGEVVGKTHGAA